ncbi:zinc ribbon domain-containing protein [Lentibacillus salicampi]|uniref:Zinc ribbon domain-containing protein n=1 Tax=Lentibacillus salicampi TaxID=175306 RepID=A0A4Y9A901_9BACI|nr:zinc ribbon domain-containing protein [Lentibacillus salicampi]TFJ92329.1 zinc ribbon domain-containing protein [Lentibacillus salicampi]
MQCPSCGQYSEEGKFCTSCGAQLVPEHEQVKEEYSGDNEVSAASVNPGQDKETGESSNEFVEVLKNKAIDFGHFFITLVKNPDEAKKANHSDMISSLIAIILFALLLSVSYHFILTAIPAGFFSNVSILDSFILPLITFVLLEFLIAGLTFAGAKLSAQAVTFPDVIAKYGAYLIPFLLLYAVGLIFSLIGISALAGILILISILGLLLLTPTFILLEQPAEGFDRIYVLLGLYIIVILAFAFFSQSFLSSIVGNMMDTMLRGY